NNREIIQRISNYDARGRENRALDDSRKTLAKTVNVGWRREWETSRTDRATRTATSLSGSSTTPHATSRFRLFSSVSWHLRRSGGIFRFGVTRNVTRHSARARAHPVDEIWAEPGGDTSSLGDAHRDASIHGSNRPSSI